MGLTFSQKYAKLAVGPLCLSSLSLGGKMMNSLVFLEEICKNYISGGTAAAGASAQHCTVMTNWPNIIRCLGSDDILSLGIKSSATEVLGSRSLVCCDLLLIVAICCWWSVKKASINGYLILDHQGR